MERAEGLRDVPGPAGERVAPTVLWRVPTGGKGVLPRCGVHHGGRGGGCVIYGTLVEAMSLIMRTMLIVKSSYRFTNYIIFVPPCEMRNIHVQGVAVPRQKIARTRGSRSG